MGAVRTEVARWITEAGPGVAADQVAAALALLRGPLTEDKLAGVLLLTEHVLPASPTSKMRRDSVRPVWGGPCASCRGRIPIG